MKPTNVETRQDKEGWVESPESMAYPDQPLPTPPPMANIMMTSRFDLQTRGGCGYRRILSSRSTEFRSPILTRSQVFQNFENPTLARTYSAVTGQLGLSPLPRHRNFEDLSKKLEDLEQNSMKNAGSKYLSRDSVLSQELEEVRSLSYELRNKYGEEISPEYQSVFYNEHYMSDIDENEEIQQFSCGYKIPERRYSDNSEKNISQVHQSFRNSYSTLPSTFKCVKSAPIEVSRTFGSGSSMKSSDYYMISPLLGKKKDFGGQDGGFGVMKSPYRTIVKLAKIR